MIAYEPQSSLRAPALPTAWPDAVFRVFTVLGMVEVMGVWINLLLHPDTPAMMDQELFVRIWAGFVFGPLVLLVGAFIVWRVPGNAVGRFLVLIAMGALAAQLGVAFRTPGSTALGLGLIILFTMGIVAPCLGYLMLTFPDGRVYPPRLKWPIVAAGFLKFFGVLLEILASRGSFGFFHLPGNPLFFPSLEPYRPVISVTIGATGILLPAIIVTGLAALLVRYRESTPAARQQIRWVIWGLGLLIPLGWTAFICAFLYGFSSLSFRIAFALSACTHLLFLASIAIGIFRYHLFDIDVLINRTLVYSALSIIVVGSYVLAVGTAARLFQETGSFLFSLIATGMIAVLFQPLRLRLQRAVNRMMYGERDDPYAVLSHFGQRLEATLAPQAILPTIVETVAHGLKLPYVAIRLKQEDEFHIAASIGAPPRQEYLTLNLPLIYQGEIIGDMILAPRAPGDPFSTADRRLLADLAPQVAGAVHVVHLTDDLQRSRERLVTAREEERRRLRRDLHDGIGPALATQSLKLETARDAALSEPGRSVLLLDELVHDCQTIIANLREVVYGLRPPALDELGLISALREHCAQYSHAGVTIRFEVPKHLPILPAAVEVAVYRIAQEALMNVIRHAKAQSCLVSISMDDETLRLRIEDDGQGLPAGRSPGVGLNSMRERAAELGGTCLVEALAGSGTRVTARLPLQFS